MVVCAQCRRRMDVVEIGVAVRWGGDWVRRGDRFRCATCGAEVVAGVAIEGCYDRSELGSYLEMHPED